jgi:uncharacterized protein (TIGR00162 family)
MNTEIKLLKKPVLKNPIFVEGLPGIGNVGRVAAGYLVEELKAEKFAELHSGHFLPFVLVHESAEVQLLRNEFYYYKAKKKNERDIIFLIGDSQSLDPQGHYNIAWEILEFVEKFGVKEVYTLGGLATGQMEGAPKVLGAVSDAKLVNKYKKFGISFDTGTKVGTIIGASGLIIGLGKLKGMEGMCLMGETAGFPIVTDPKAAEAVLGALMKILNIKLDMSKLEKRVEEMEKFIKKIEGLQKRAEGQIVKKDEKGDQLRYIG